MAGPGLWSSRLAHNTPQNTRAHSGDGEMFIVKSENDMEVKAVIWTATGTRAFCSGAPMRGYGESPLPVAVREAYESRNLMPDPQNVLSNLTKAFWDFPKPLVFAINGVAVGGGANLALMNFGDIVLCSSLARFKYPVAELGIAPELSSSYTLPYLVGFAKAKELLMVGDWFSADQALNMGLCNEVCSPGDLMARARNCFEISFESSREHAYHQVND